MIDRILLLMKNNNITATKLTADLGLSNSAISEWKKGKGKPTADAIVKLANYFDVSTDYLLIGTEDDDLYDKKTNEDIDVAIAMRKIKKRLSTEQGLLFDGEILDTETANLFLLALEQQEKMIKEINKKYTPKKHLKNKGNKDTL